MGDAPADPVAIALAGIRERAKAAADLPLAEFAEFTSPDTKSIGGWIAASALDVPRLLEAAEAALGLHQPQPVYGRAIPDLCGHDPDSDPDAHYEADDGYWYCRDKITGRVCGACAGDDPDFMHAEWPCPTYLAIAEALTGKE